jgi:hypothetical protein
MSKRPSLYLVEGGLAQERRRIYRLRETRPHEAPAEEPWPKAGEWRALIRRLMRNPVKGV